MPTFELTTPDGAQYHIDAPDQATAVQAFHQHTGSDAGDSGVIAPAIPNRSFSEGFTHGLAEPFYGAGQLLTHGASGVTDAAASAGVPGAATAQEYTRGLAGKMDAAAQRSEQDYTSRNADNSAASMGRVAGNMLATLPVAALAPESIPGGLIARGAIQGVGMGLLEPATGPENFWAQKAKQAGDGAVTGGVGGGVVGAAARMVSPQIAPAVQKLLDKNVRLTPGHILGGVTDRLEEAAKSTPIAGDFIRGARNRAIQDFNRATINDALAPIQQELGAKTEIGRAAIQEASQKVDNVYNQLIPNSGFTPDNVLVNKLQQLQKATKALYNGRHDQFNNMLVNDVYPRFAKGAISGKDYKDLESTLGARANDYLHSPSPDDRDYGVAILKLRNMLRENLARSNPQIADQLGNVNEAYSRLLRVQSAAASSGAQNGVYSPAHFSRAVRALDPSIRKNAFAKGDALMQDWADAGRDVLGDKVPDSGTAYRILANGALLGGGGLTYLANPALALGAAGGITTGSALYTRAGQAILRGLLTKRPLMAARAASILRKAQLPRAVAAAVTEPDN